MRDGEIAALDQMCQRTRDFVDDREANPLAAENLGFIPVEFSDAENLRGDLVQLGVLPKRTPDA